MKYKLKTLKNGLKIITVPMIDNPTVTVIVAVGTGSLNEKKSIMGISHFLEHMTFKGTVKRPTAFSISSELDAIGAESNAFTDKEITAYFAKADKTHLDTVLDVVSDLYLNPTLPADELEKERGVILQEYKMYLDNPKWTVDEVWEAHLYGDTPAGWNIVGIPETIASVQQKDFLNYRKTFYVASNTTVVVAGNINTAEIEKKVEKIFAQIPVSPTGKKNATKEKKQTKPEVHIEFKETDQTHLVLGVRSFDAFDNRNKTMRVLRGVLSSGMSSRLFQKMREELGICYYVYASQDGYMDHGHFSVHAGVDQKRLPIAVEAILVELRKIVTEPISKEELLKVKEGMIGRMNLSIESSDDVAQMFARRSAEGKELLTPEQVAKEIRAVTAEDIQKLAKELFVDKNLNLVVLGKHKNEKELNDILSFNL